jgi:hypothetical protein
MSRKKQCRKKTGAKKTALTIGLKRHMFPRNRDLGCFRQLLVKAFDPHLDMGQKLKRSKKCVSAQPLPFPPVTSDVP